VQPADQDLSEGLFMHGLARELWPITRSITGDGVRETLAILGEHVPGLVVHEVPSGTPAFDWTVPDEWNVRSARLVGPDGTVIADLDACNLHVVGYSSPVDVHLELDELQQHLHSLPDQPTAVPYVTSYYSRNWGFCLRHDVRERLQPGTYHAVIDSTLEPGHLTYGEVILPGASEDEVFVSTYVCHPSMANNELSGPVVTAALARWVAQLPNRHYTYRFAFAPETIGALTYASRNLEALRSRVVAAFNLTCIGDDRAYTYLASREGNLRVDRIAKRVLQGRENVVEYSYLMRGSDERHYCAPGIDLPMISLMRSRYADYPEYHTSLDDLEHVVTPTGLQGGLDVVRECIDVLEAEQVLVATQLGEPQLGRRGLYHQIMGKAVHDEILLRTHILSYADGRHSIADMAQLFDVPVDTLRVMVDELKEHDLIREHHQSNRRTAGVLD
jgi:aminopeptidase-like protein